MADAPQQAHEAPGQPIEGPPAPPAVVFRLPRLAYLAVLFLLFSVIPLAFAGDAGEQGSPGGLTWRVALLIIPVAAAVFIARTQTRVDRDGLRVRLALGTHGLAWADISGLHVAPRAIYAVARDGGAIRLPCVRVPDLPAIARLSGGRLPELREAPLKYAPSGRRRRARRPG